MRIILPGLESVATTRHALQDYVNKVARLVNVDTVLVTDKHAKSLLEAVTVDALTFGMTSSAKYVYDKGLEVLYMDVLNPILRLLTVRVEFDDLYTDLLDDLVVSHWSLIEPFLDDAVPYNVEVRWIGTNLLITAPKRGIHHVPTRKPLRTHSTRVDHSFSMANKASLSQTPPKGLKHFPLTRHTVVSLLPHLPSNSESMLTDEGLPRDWARQCDHLIAPALHRELATDTVGVARGILLKVVSLHAMAHGPQETLNQITDALARANASHATTVLTPDPLPHWMIVRRPVYQRTSSLSLLDDSQREYEEGHFDSLIDDLLKDHGNNL